MEIDNILDDLDERSSDYELDGVEFTEEDAKRVQTLMKKEGYSYDLAVDKTLNEIYDVISEGWNNDDDFDG